MRLPNRAFNLAINMTRVSFCLQRLPRREEATTAGFGLETFLCRQDLLRWQSSLLHRSAHVVGLGPTSMCQQSRQTLKAFLESVMQSRTSPNNIANKTMAGNFYMKSAMERNFGKKLLFGNSF